MPVLFEGREIVLDDTGAGKLAWRQFSQLVQPVKHEGFPEVGIVDQGEVFSRAAICQAISRRFHPSGAGAVFDERPPAFIARARHVNLAIYDAFAVIQVRLYRAAGIKHTASTAELHGAFKATAIGGDEVDAVLEGARQPAI